MKTKCKILIIDDDLQQCITLEHIFTEEGYSVSYLENSSKALKKIKEKFYHVILIDLVLPNVSGIELLKQIKTVSPQSFVIIMTGYATTENAVEALNYGAFAYLIKPLNISQLLGLIERAIEMQELDQQKLQVKEEEWQALKEYKSLIDRVAMGIFLIQDGRIVFVNQSAETVLGYSIDELIGARVESFVSPQDSEIVLSRIKDRLQGKNPPHCYTFKAIGKNNKLIDVEVYSIPTHYGGKEAILCTAINVTEKVRKQKEQEEELRYQTLLNRYTSQLINAKSQKKIFEIAEQVIYEIGDEFSCIAMLSHNRSFLSIKRIIKSAKLLNKLQKITAGKFPSPELKGFRISLKQKGNVFKKVIAQGLPLIAGDINIDKEVSIIKSDLKEISEAFVNNSDLQKSLSRILKHIPFKSVVIFPIKTMTKVIGLITITCHSILPAKKFYFAKNLAISIGISLERLAFIDTLKHSEKRYKDLFEKAVDGIFIINLQGEFVDGNQAALRISGYKKEELVGKPFHQIIAPQYIKSTSAAVDNLIEGKEDYIQQELEIINKDEHFVPLEARATLIKNKGQPIAIQGIFRDITKRKQMEKALKQSEGKYYSLFKHSVDAIFVCNFQGRLIDVNQKACQLTGYTKDELLTMSIPDLHEDADLIAYKKYFKRIIAGEPIVSQADILRKDGTKVCCEFNSSIIDTAQAIVFHSIARDLSERQEAEQEIRRGYQVQTVLNKLLSLSLKDFSLEEMLNRMLQQLLSISWLVLESKGAIFLVEQDAHTLVMKAQYGLPKSIKSLCKRVPFGKCLCGQAASSKKIIFKNKIDQPMDNKDFAPHGHYCVPIISTKKNVLGVICLFLKQGHCEDKKEEEFLETVANVIAGIIERKRAEEIVRESEEKYSTLVEGGNDGIVIIQDNQLKYVNSKMSEIVGASVEELIGTSFIDYIPPELKSFVKDMISRRISGEEVPGKYEIELLTKSGEKVPVEINASLIQYKGKPADMAIVRDITERKQTEKALRESEERYRKMFESMSDAVAIFEAVDDGKDFIFKEINKAAEETERIVKEEVIGKSVDKVFPGVKDFGLFGVFQRVWRTGKPEHHPMSFYEDKRISGWRENYVYKLPSGEVVSIYEDVTRRKNLQDAILKMYLELSTLNTIISSVSRTLSLEKVLHISLESTSIAADWDGGFIGILEKKERQREVIIPYSTKGISEEFKQKIINDTSLCEVFLKLSYCKDSAIVIDNVEKEPLIDSKLKKLIKKEGILSLVLVPLKVKDRLKGLIVGVDKRIKRISHDNLALLSSIGQQVGIAIENAQLYKKIKESEERYRAIFENSQLGIYIATPEGKFKACNQALAKIDGYSSPKELMEAYLEKNIYVHPEDMKRLRRKLNSEGYITNYEIDYRRKDGKIITCLETAVAIKDENGEIIEYHGTILDISQRKKLQEELKKSEEKYHTIFDNVPVSIFLIDANGKVVDVNRYHVEVIMKNFMRKEEYIDRHILDFDFLKGTGMGGKFTELRKGKNFYVREAYFPDSYRGGPKCYNIQGTPLLTNGRVTGAIILLADVTDLKKLQMELMQSEKLSALGEMISGVAHELNNPLTSVLGYSQLFQQYDVSQDLKEDLNKIRSEAERCHRIVQNLLRFARRHKPGKIYTDINGVIENALELMAYELKVNNIEVIKELDMNLPFTMVDPYQLQQVLLNLINNAYHAMITDKGKGKLVVKSAQNQQKIKISVIDNGPGISQENLPKIFDPFFSTKEPGEGTGLGLSLSYGIIKEHQGEILVESELGKGSTFIIKLPIIDYPVKKDTEKPPAIVKKKPVGARVLVVEDEEILRSLILQLLQREGYKVSSAENGLKALEMIDQNNYNAIISDIKMPRLSGKEFYKRLKQQRPELANRVIFLTGDVLNTNTNQFLSQLEDRYLTKPFNNEHLLNLIAEVINKNERIEREYSNSR